MRTNLATEILICEITSTMLGQSKNVYQAEIDSACELIDFFNFNCEYLYNIHKQQCIRPCSMLFLSLPFAGAATKASGNKSFEVIS